jgi:lipopolysaccharide export system ATP-binding protein|tara:strand:- start:4934 stop:5713 length:780 start_codon:yes stop_codon:yes gene_type:complete
MAIIKKFRITTFKKETNKISLKNISLSYNKRQILDDISLNFREGEICGLLGPNGVGKSTLFNIIIGLIKPNYGTVLINKTNVTNIPIYERALNFKLSIVPQSGGVFSELSCLNNLIAVGQVTIKEKDLINFKVENMISKFSLDAVKDLKAKHLSGGQRKKLCIAMALMSDPKIILMDEPFQGLDIMSTKDLQETIANLQTEDGTRCCIISDHAARDLLAICDKAIILANKKIIAEGSPNDLMNNQNAKRIYFGDAFKLS